MIFAALIVTLIAVLLGIFLSNDADLPLILLPKPPAKVHEGKVVWIVGASSGIGAYLAEDFCREGAHVILSSRRLTQLQEVADKCAKAGPFPALVLPLDVTKYEEHQTAFNHVMEVYGRIDVLVLNAGISQRNLADDTPFSVTEDIMKLNFFSLVALNKIVLPTFLKQKSGKVSYSTYLPPSPLELCIVDRGDELSQRNHRNSNRLVLFCLEIRFGKLQISSNLMITDLLFFSTAISMPFERRLPWTT